MIFQNYCRMSVSQKCTPQFAFPFSIFIFCFMEAQFQNEYKPNFEVLMFIYWPYPIAFPCQRVMLKGIVLNGGRMCLWMWTKWIRFRTIPHSSFHCCTSNINESHCPKTNGRRQTIFTSDFNNWTMLGSFVFFKSESRPMWKNQKFLVSNSDVGLCEPKP